jgi:hypothetical protein
MMGVLMTTPAANALLVSLHQPDDRSLQLVEICDAELGEPNHAGLVDDHGHRQALHAVPARRILRCVERDRIVDRIAVGKERLDLGCIFLRDADDDEPLGLHVAVPRVQRRKRFHAGNAPRCPEIEDHDLAAQ